jgi:hypothetical protein
MGLPVGATHGAAFSGLIEVWGDVLDKTMRVRFAHSYDSLTGEDMLDTAANAASWYYGSTYLLNRAHVIHGDVTSDWRPSLEEVVLPRWFKFALPIMSGKLIIDDYVWAYEGV